MEYTVCVDQASTEVWTTQLQAVQQDGHDAVTKGMPPKRLTSAHRLLKYTTVSQAGLAIAPGMHGPALHECHQAMAISVIHVQILWCICAKKQFDMLLAGVHVQHDIAYTATHPVHVSP